MQRVVKVKFRNSGRSYYFDALDFDIHDGTSVIVNTAHGDMLGTTSGEPAEMDETRLSTPLKPVLRIAAPEDLSQMEYYRSKEGEALAICRSKIEARGLEMKLVDAEYAFNGSKLTFYFTAENRVDFRELLKDLTAVFKSRIDLRQIGDRDEAKKCGGLGFCGRPVCCNTFLSEFTPVSIKMAKTQNLSLNPLKISGICGKLMCCLRYEQEAYESMQKVMPRIGKEFITPDGPGVVLENNVITETTKLKITLPDGTFDIRSYPFRELITPESEPCEGGECEGCGNCEGCLGGAHENAQQSAETTPESDGEAAAAQTDDKPAEAKRDKPHRQARHHDRKNVQFHRRSPQKAAGSSGGGADGGKEGEAKSGAQRQSQSQSKPHRRFNAQHKRRSFGPNQTAPKSEQKKGE